jgi:hypothetical protein
LFCNELQWRQVAVELQASKTKRPALGRPFGIRF